MENAAIWIGVLVGLVALGAYLFWRRRAAKQDKPLISLVLLLRQPRLLDTDGLAKAATRAFDRDMTSQDKDAQEFVVGEDPQYLVKVEGTMLMVLNVATPYVQDVNKEAGTIPDLRLRKAFQAHRAWLSVDLLGEPKETALDQAYRYIAKLIAELAGDDCLAIYSPATNQMNVFDAELLAKLRGPDPLEAVAELVHPPMVQIEADDPKMKAAVEEARRRWPEFVAAFKERRPGHRFSIKAPITRGEIAEFIWIEVTAIEGDVIRGKLANEPVDLQGLKLNDPVEVKVADLNDWMYGGKDAVHGGFTVKVLMEAQKQRR